MSDERPNATPPTPAPATPTPAPAAPAADAAPVLSENDQIRHRLDKLALWQADGVLPFGERFDGTVSAATARAKFDEATGTGGVVTLAGRVTANRRMGKSVFLDVRDSSDRLQLYAQKNVLGDAGFDRLQRLDLGDLIGVTGEIFKTRMGEITLRVQDFRLLAKAMRPLPEKFHGLADVEQRYRQRYLDLICSPESLKLFQTRVRIVREVRRVLEDQSFVEVETPMMQPLAGGAAARPFVTHYNALDCRMYLRIAPELYLKRLLVGGMERVFELNRNFRNEGLSRKHNPEVTMLEAYQAYGDCRTMMDLVENLVCTVAERVMGTLQLKHAGDKVIDLKRPWRRVAYRDLLREVGGADWFDVSAAERRARVVARGLHVSPAMTDIEVTQEFYEKVIEPTLIQPTFVIRLPRELVPLAKTCPDDPTLVDVYELEINGQELSPGYSELNDPIEQRKRFEEQVAAGAEGVDEQGRIDEDFLLAMEHGMPPAGGMGLGIDRLVMLLTGAESIRDVILFPQLRPRAAQGALIVSEPTRDGR